MRILLINYERPPLGGGGGVVAADLGVEFVRMGHEVDYLTTHHASLAREEVVEGVRVIRVPVLGRRCIETAGMLSMVSFPPSAIWRGLRLARRNRYDILHTHFAIPTGPAGYRLSKWLRLPNVLTVYGGDIYDPSKAYSPHRNPVLRYAVRCILNQAEVVVGESQDLCDRTVSIYGPRTEVLRIPLGFRPLDVERPARSALGLRDDRLYAAAVGRLVRRKAYDDLIRALGRSGVDELDLLIVGDGPEGERLRVLAAELGLAERVHFLGHVDDITKYRYLTVSDIFALASLHEGFGICYLEAMQCGLPIATTNVGGHTDFLADGRNALLTPPQDPEALGHSLSVLARDAAMRRRLGDKNREEVKAFTMENMARRYVEVFERVLASRAAPIHER